MALSKTILDFQKAHPTKESKAQALRGMNNAQIDRLINAAATPQAKTFYASFKKKK